MANLIIDMSDDELNEKLEGFKPMPAGIYEVEIISAEQAESKSEKNLGKPLYKLEYKVINADDPAFNGRKLFHTVCLWKEAIYTCLQMMRALGYPVETPLEVPHTDDLIGKSYQVKVKIEKSYRDPEQDVNAVDRILYDDSKSTTTKSRSKKNVNFD